MSTSLRSQESLEGRGGSTSRRCKIPRKPVLHVIYTPSEGDPHGILDGDPLEGHPPVVHRIRGAWRRCQIKHATSVPVIWQGKMVGELGPARLLDRLGRHLGGIADGHYLPYGEVTWTRPNPDLEPYIWQLALGDGVYRFGPLVVPALGRPPAVPKTWQRCWSLAEVCSHQLGGHVDVLR